MTAFANAVLLLTALVLPVLLFVLFRPRTRGKTLLAAAVAIAAGWAFNVACIVAMQALSVGEGTPADPSMVSVATRFGWACPGVLVLLTALMWRWIARRGAVDSGAQRRGLA